MLQRRFLGYRAGERDMTIPVYSSARSFRVWMYAVGHSILLLRSLKSIHFPTRIDVLFVSVDAMCVSMNLAGIHICQRDSAPLPAGLSAVGEGYKLFTLGDGLQAPWVVGGNVAWHEDEGNDTDPSHFRLPRMVISQ